MVSYGVSDVQTDQEPQQFWCSIMLSGTYVE